MVVDGEADAVVLDERVHGRQELVVRHAADDAHARGFGVTECLPRLGLRSHIANAAELPMPAMAAVAAAVVFAVLPRNLRLFMSFMEDRLRSG